jgi:hypothetical protein
LPGACTRSERGNPRPLVWALPSGCGTRAYEALPLSHQRPRKDQERRNHAVQYVSHPDWPWFRLRKESPSKYEPYVDLRSGVWTRIKIEVQGDRGRL